MFTFGSAVFSTWHLLMACTSRVSMRRSNRALSGNNPAPVAAHVHLLVVQRHGKVWSFCFVHFVVSSVTNETCRPINLLTHSLIFKYSRFTQLPASKFEHPPPFEVDQHNRICGRYLITFGLNCRSVSEETAKVVVASHGRHC